MERDVTLTRQDLTKPPASGLLPTTVPLSSQAIYAGVLQMWQRRNRRRGTEHTPVARLRTLQRVRASLRRDELGCAEAFRDFDLRAPGIGHVDDSQSRRVGAVADRGVGLEAGR